jgi:hypothetical protein
LYLDVRIKEKQNVFSFFFKKEKRINVPIFIALIKTTGTKIIRYDDISNSITKKQQNQSFNLLIFVSLTRQIEHFEYLWHRLNDNRFPKNTKDLFWK